MGLQNLKQMHFLAIDSDFGRLCKKTNGQIQKFESVSGNLIKLGKHSHVYEGEFIEKLDMFLEDKDELYQISFGIHSYLAHNLLNLLASIPTNLPMRIIKLSAYKKDNFIKLFALINNEKLTWKYSPNEIPTETNNDFFENLYKELEKKFEQIAQSEAEKINSHKDDVPF